MNSLLPKLRLRTAELTRAVSRSSARSASTSNAAPSINPGTNTARARPFIYVLGFMPIVCLGLGGWQVQRLRWKLDMIDQLEAKLNKDTVRLPSRIEYVPRRRRSR